MHFASLCSVLRKNKAEAFQIPFSFIQLMMFLLSCNFSMKPAYRKINNAFLQCSINFLSSYFDTEVKFMPKHFFTIDLIIWQHIIKVFSTIEIYFRIIFLLHSPVLLPLCKLYGMVYIKCNIDILNTNIAPFLSFVIMCKHTLFKWVL